MTLATFPSGKSRGRGKSLCCSSWLPSGPCWVVGVSATFDQLRLLRSRRRRLSASGVVKNRDGVGVAKRGDGFLRSWLHVQTSYLLCFRDVDVCAPSLIFQRDICALRPGLDPPRFAELPAEPPAVCACAAASGHPVCMRVRACVQNVHASESYTAKCKI